LRELEEILEEIKELPKGNELINYREVRYLPHILEEDEYIEHMTLATFDERAGCLVITDERVLLIFSASHYLSYSLDDLEHVYLEQSGYNGILEIFLENQKFIFTNIATDDAKDIKEYLMDYCYDYNGSSDVDTVTKTKKSPSAIILIVCAIIGGIIGYFTTPIVYEKVVYDPYLEHLLTVEEAESQKQLILSDLEFYVGEDSYDTYAVGKLTNQSDKKYDFVALDVQYYNKYGDIIESEIESVTNLKPGQSWVFKWYPWEEQVVDFDIVGFEISQYESID